MSLKNKPLKNAAVFSGIAAQMALTIYLGSKLGKWLDAHYTEPEPFYETWVTLAAVLLATVSIIYQATRFFK